MPAEKGGRNKPSSANEGFSAQQRCTYRKLAANADRTQARIAQVLGVHRRTVDEWLDTSNVKDDKASNDARISVPKSKQPEIVDRIEVGESQSQVAADYGISQGADRWRFKPVAGRYSFQTWEEYVSDRWEMTFQHAHRLIESAMAAESLKTSPIGDVLPARESHVRELLKLDSESDTVIGGRAKERCRDR